MTLKKKIPVSVILTVYNEGKDIHYLFESILCQTVKPMELIIVDGGSSDDTVGKITSFIQAGNDWVQLVVDPTCSSKFSDSPIAKGRNVGINKATQEIIAITDASSVLEPHWLERISQPLIEDVADYVGGFYEINTGDSLWGKYFALLNTPLVENIHSFIPSSRSFAFRKVLWKMVGGYPLGYKYGEDTEFVLRIQSKDARRSIRPDAIVTWHPTKIDKWDGGISLMFKYARGNGQRNLFLMRHVKHFLYYSALFMSMLLSVICFSFSALLAGFFFILLLIFFGGLMLRAFLIYYKGRSSIRFGFSIMFVIYLSSVDIVSVVGYVIGVVDRLGILN